MEKAKKVADEKGQKVHIGSILSSEIFYHADPTAMKKWQDMGILSVEMESVALYWNAIQARVNALCILTVSDHLITGKQTTTEERQTAFTKMMEIALELA